MNVVESLLILSRRADVIVRNIGLPTPFYFFRFTTALLFISHFLLFEIHRL